MWRLRARDERYAWRDAKLREGRSLRVEKHIILHLAPRLHHRHKIFAHFFVDEAEGKRERIANSYSHS